VLAVGHGGGRVVRTACSREGIGAAECVGQPVPAGHAPDQIRRISAGHPGRGDEQRASRGSAHDRHRVGRGAEPGLGHPDHRDAELGVRMRAQAGPEPAPGIRTVSWQQPARVRSNKSNRSRSVIGLCEACACNRRSGRLCGQAPIDRRLCRSGCSGRVSPLLGMEPAQAARSGGAVRLANSVRAV
jgi:hypothetical protein